MVHWNKKAVGCIKRCLIGHTSKKMKDNGLECDELESYKRGYIGEKSSYVVI